MQDTLPGPLVVHNRGVPLYMFLPSIEGCDNRVAVVSLLSL